MRPLKLLLFLLLLAAGAGAQRLPALIPFYHSATDKYGYADSTGRLVIPPQWDKAELFVGGKAYVTIKMKLPGRQRPADITCTIRPDGSYVVPPAWGWEKGDGGPVMRPGQWYNSHSSDYPALVGLFLRTHLLSGESDWERLTSFERYLASLPAFNATDTATGKRGIIDTSGKLIVSLEFEDGQLLYDRESDTFYFLGSKNHRYGLMDLRGHELIPFHYDEMKCQSHDSSRMLFIAKAGDSARLLDRSGMNLIPDGFRGIRYSKESKLVFGYHSEPGFWMVSTGKGQGLYDTSFREIIPPVYESAYPEDGRIQLYRKASGPYYEWAQADYRGHTISQFRRTDTINYQSFALEPSRYHSPLYYQPGRQDLTSASSGYRKELLVGQTWYWLTEELAPERKKEKASAWYAAVQLRPVQGYHFKGILSAVVDDAGRLVMPPQPLPILNAVWPFVQCRDGDQYVLLDTTGNQVARVPAPVVTWMQAGDGSRIFLQSSPKDLAQAPLHPGSWLLVHITDSGGKLLERFRNYHSFRIPDREDPGKKVLYARDRLGREGLLDADGKVRVPALSFHYSSLQRIPSDTSRQWLRPRVSYDIMEYTDWEGEPQSWMEFSGGFRVTDSNGKTGYLRADGKAVLPALNFRYSGSIWPLSRHLFLLEEMKGFAQLLDRSGNEVLKHLHLSTACRVKGYPDLVLLTGGELGGAEKDFFISDSGVLFAD